MAKCACLLACPPIQFPSERTIVREGTVSIFKRLFGQWPNAISNMFGVMCVQRRIEWDLLLFETTNWSGQPGYIRHNLFSPHCRAFIDWIQNSFLIIHNFLFCQKFCFRFQWTTTPDPFKCTGTNREIRNWFVERTSFEYGKWNMIFQCCIYPN